MKDNMMEDVSHDELMKEIVELESYLYHTNVKLLGLNDEMSYTPKSCVDRFMWNLKQRTSNNTIMGVPSGFAEIDKETDGWQTGELVIVAGEPSSGKTSFLVAMTKHIAVDDQIPMAFFSLAQSGCNLIQRMVSHYCEIEGDNIGNAQLAVEEFEKIEKATDLLSKAPLYINDSIDLSFFDIKTMARHLIRETGMRLMIIDNLQMVNVSNMNFNSRQEEYAYINKGLKNLALELNIPILVTCETPCLQMTNYDLVNRYALLESIHKFGAIEQSADMVVFLENKDGCEGDVIHTKRKDVVIAKHRNGDPKLIKLCFIGECSSFDEKK